MNKFTMEKLNNKGYSIVELIVAMGVAMIVASSVAGLLAFSVSQYRNQTVNAALQYEIQTSVNQITDAIVSSTGMVIGQNSTTSGPYTDYAAFGEFKGTGGTGVTFDGVVFVAGAADSNGRFDIYMDRVSGESGSNSQAAVASTVSNIKSHIGDNPNPYLLGEDVKVFRIEPQSQEIGVTTPLRASSNTYINPIVVDVELEFERDASNGNVINKKILEDAYMRNTVKLDVFVGPSGSEVGYAYSKE